MAEKQTGGILPLKIRKCQICCSRFQGKWPPEISVSSEDPIEAVEDAMTVSTFTFINKIRAFHRFHTANEDRPEAEIIRKLRSAGGPAEEAPAIPLNSAGDGPCLICSVAVADPIEDFKQNLMTRKALIKILHQIIGQHGEYAQGITA